MNPDLDARLVTAFPSLYRDRDASLMVSLMPFGFECGDGWFDIIRRLSERLEPLGAVATQVKEKYGTLRFYIFGGGDAADAAIDEAERESETTCEICGEPGRLIGECWFSVRCERCEREEHERWARRANT